MNIFVDNHREPKNIYRDHDQWICVKTELEFKKVINESLSKNDLPISISFDYDLDGESDGLKCLVNFVDTCIRLRLKLPKILLHCVNRELAIDFENALDKYTKNTKIPYNFEYVKRN